MVLEYIPPDFCVNTFSFLPSNDGIVWLDGKYMHIFWRNCRALFQRGCIIFYSHLQRPHCPTLTWAWRVHTAAAPPNPWRGLGSRACLSLAWLGWDPNGGRGCSLPAMAYPAAPVGHGVPVCLSHQAPRGLAPGAIWGWSLRASRAGLLAPWLPGPRLLLVQHRDQA